MRLGGWGGRVARGNGCGYKSNTSSIPMMVVDT